VNLESALHQFSKTIFGSGSFSERNLIMIYAILSLAGIVFINRSLLTNLNLRSLSHLFHDKVIRRFQVLYGVAIDLVGLKYSELLLEFCIKFCLGFIFAVILINTLALSIFQSILIGVLIISLFVHHIYIYRERIIKNYCKQFEEQLIDFIESFALSINSGLSLTAGFSRVMNEYLHQQFIAETKKVSRFSGPPHWFSWKLEKRRDGESQNLYPARKTCDPMARELSKISHDLSQGKSVVQALDLLANRINSHLVSDLVDALTQSIARGTPLGNLLADHAQSMRERQRRILLERAGKAEVKMMVPVVFLLLPISVLFALWPSFQQLQQFVVIQ
jgi:pilus assembly protein TadC